MKGKGGGLKMMLGFLTLYIELASLIVSGGIISTLSISSVLPNSISPEQALLLSMQ
jgi:hypothetical protein